MEKKNSSTSNIDNNNNNNKGTVISTRRSTCSTVATIESYVGGDNYDHNTEISEAVSVISKEEIIRRKSLQSQWAGGKDLWTNVPYCCQFDEHHDGNNDDAEEGQRRYFRVVTRQLNPNETTADAMASMSWPWIVQRSVLFGLTASNPQGNVVEESINMEQNERLKHEIMERLQENDASYDKKDCWWNGMGLWEDGSSESGFIVAFYDPSIELSQEELNSQSSAASNDSSTNLELKRQWIIDLATKYDQGAIYEYKLVSNDDDDHPPNTDTDDGKRKLIRSTIPVLIPDTESDVEIVIEEIQIVAVGRE